jgi:hypothetical protein
MDKRKGYVLLLINAGVRSSVSERKKSRRLENGRVVTIGMLHQLVVRNTIFRKTPPSVVSGYGKRSINLNKVVATFEKHIGKLTWIFILWELHSDFVCLYNYEFGLSLCKIVRSSVILLLPLYW